MLGRLQTDADRARVIEGLGEDKQCCCFSLAGKKSELGNIVKRLAHRWFVVRDAKSEKLTLLNPRFALRATATVPLLPQL